MIQEIRKRAGWRRVIQGSVESGGIIKWERGGLSEAKGTCRPR